MDAKRCSKRFCDSTCRGRFHREKRSDIERELTDAWNTINRIRIRHFTDNHSPEQKVSALHLIQSIEHEINKMVSVIGATQEEQADTWYQCLGCGQRTFCKVDTCDFCGGSKSKAIYTIK